MMLQSNAYHDIHIHGSYIANNSYLRIFCSQMEQLGNVPYNPLTSRFGCLSPHSCELSAKILDMCLFLMLTIVTGTALDSYNSEIPLQELLL
jgi:hypothetical protein